MRILLTCIVACLFCLAYADDGSGFDDSSTPAPVVPTSSSTASSATSSTSSSSDFGGMVQQQTSQAMQTFQNVNYQKLSGAESQEDFFSDDNNNDNDNPPDPDHLFNVFGGN